MKTDIILLADVFKKYIKVSIEKSRINPLHCVSISSYTIQCCLKHTDIELETMQDKDKIFYIENYVLGGISSVMGDRYIKSNENKKKYFIRTLLNYVVFRCHYHYHLMELNLKEVFV